MKTILLLISAITLAGCTSLNNSPSTPPPTDEFTAEGYHNNPAGSVEYARRQAAQFCKHWKAAPGIITSETVNLRGDSPAEAGKEMASRVLTTGKLFRKDLPYRTTITYKCH